MDRIKTYQEFWPFYLREHSNKTNRILHFVGTSIGFAFLVQFFLTFQVKWFFMGLFAGYLFAWVGHFAVEKNKPATFKYPLWSFASDWRMWFLTMIGKLPKNYFSVQSTITK